MCRARHAADFFIDAGLRDPEENMTNMRINKLLYFAQGWCLARYGRPLFRERIEAWTYGPVVPTVYRRLKIAGHEKIGSILDESYASHFDDEEQSLLLDVLREYGKFSTAGLVDLTHRPGSPWSEATKNGRNAEISPASMKKYFSALPPLPSFTLPKFKESDFIGHGDEETGNYVLPKEWDDDN